MRALSVLRGWARTHLRGTGTPRDGGKLDVYTAKVSATRAAKLAAKYDVYGQRQAKGGVRLGPRTHARCSARS